MAWLWMFTRPRAAGPSLSSRDGMKRMVKAMPTMRGTPRTDWPYVLHEHAAQAAPVEQARQRRSANPEQRLARSRLQFTHCTVLPYLGASAQNRNEVGLHQSPALGWKMLGVPGGPRGRVGKHLYPFLVERGTLLGRILDPKRHLDDVVDRATGGLDIMPDVAKHVGDLLLERGRQLARTWVGSTDHARHDDVADAGGVGDRVRMACMRPVDALAPLHGRPSRFGGLLGPEARHLGTVIEGLVAFGRQLLGVIQRRVNVALPNFTR